MYIKEFLNDIIQKGVENDNLVKLHKKIAPLSFSDKELRLLISALDENPIFFDDEKFYRLISFDEVLNTESEFGINIKRKGIIPFIDCGDNEFICYDLGKYTWCKYNISDDYEYSQTRKLLSYFD